MGEQHRLEQSSAQLITLPSSNQIYTYRIGHHLEGVSHTGYSWIDHQLLHRHDNLKMVAGGFDSGEAWIIISDHPTILAELDIPGVHFDKVPLPKPPKAAPLRRPPTQNKTMLTNYKVKVESKVLRIPPALPPDKRLAAIADISVKCCPKEQPVKNFYNSTRYRGGWSPQLFAALAALTAVTRMRQHATGENKRRLWLTPIDRATGINELADEWESKHQKILWTTADERIKAFTWGKGSHHWRLLRQSEYVLLANQLPEEEKLIKGRLHERQRRDMRISIKGATAARERSRKHSNLTAVIQSICGTHTEPYSLHQLLLPNGGTTTDSLAFHDAHTAHWRQWFLGDDHLNFFSCHEID